MVVCFGFVSTRTLCVCAYASVYGKIFRAECDRDSDWMWNALLYCRMWKKRTVPSTFDRFENFLSYQMAWRYCVLLPFRTCFQIKCTNLPTFRRWCIWENGHLYALHVNHFSFEVKTHQNVLSQPFACLHFVICSPSLAIKWFHIAVGRIFLWKHKFHYVIIFRN